ncbi:MAG: peptidylprolyl isomerase [Terriglobales bacterium]|jgi:peptidyl-prolyl cis-trans isomerase A (cyclophilin A)
MQIPRLPLRVAQRSLGMPCVYFLAGMVLLGCAQAQDQRPARSATFHTTAGEFTCQLFPDQVPNAVANFAGLADGSKDWTDPETKQKKHGVPMYNGTIFHRVIPNFMIQGGDPLGTGSGDPGYSFKDEIVPSLNFDVPGRLAYANSGPDTNGSQFFITEVPTPHLNGHYVIFGQCDTAALHFVTEEAREPRDERNDRPHEPAKIVSITIVR